MKQRLLFSFLGLMLGLGVLGLSLMSGKSGALASPSGMSAKEIYLGEILPDHIAYPFIVALDRFYLETTTPTERIHFEIKYSHRRLEYARALLEKGEGYQDLALSTLTKSQKYLLKAALEGEQIELSDSTQDLLIRALIYNIKEVEDLTHQFPDFQRSVLDGLREEEQLALNKLQS